MKEIALVNEHLPARAGTLHLSLDAPLPVLCWECFPEAQLYGPGTEAQDGLVVSSGPPSLGDTPSWTWAGSPLLVSTPRPGALNAPAAQFWS